MNQPVKPPQNDVAGPKGRHTTTQVMVGNVAVGGGAPIVVQSMTNTDTADVGVPFNPRIPLQYTPRE